MNKHKWEKENGYKPLLSDKNTVFYEKLKGRSKEEIIHRWIRSKMWYFNCYLFLLLLCLASLVGGVAIGTHSEEGLRSDLFETKFMVNGIAERACNMENLGEYISTYLYENGAIVVSCEHDNIIIRSSYGQIER